ncbi:hypothetical protein FALCPG4_003360 [Fusarium falciforme]
MQGEDSSLLDKGNEMLVDNFSIEGCNINRVSLRSGFSHNPRAADNQSSSFLPEIAVKDGIKRPRPALGPGDPRHPRAFSASGLHLPRGAAPRMSAAVEGKVSFVRRKDALRRSPLVHAKRDLRLDP